MATGLDLGSTRKSFGCEVSRKGMCKRSTMQSMRSYARTSNGRCCGSIPSWMMEAIRIGARTRPEHRDRRTRYTIPTRIDRRFAWPCRLRAGRTNRVCFKSNRLAVYINICFLSHARRAHTALVAKSFAQSSNQFFDEVNSVLPMRVKMELVPIGRPAHDGVAVGGGRPRVNHCCRVIRIYSRCQGTQANRGWI